ncbi:hypothetical protein NG791_01655 [Laspinema sp. D1]|uniref:hypothetical protein n=1 Tax=Laspinema palackyanum TaxID=3231601 RepID=UPI0034720533|nr:hypothetical protein [Laspinema sp. D2b]
MAVYHPFILVDTGIMVAFYNRQDRYHQQVLHRMARWGRRLRRFRRLSWRRK